MATTLIQSVRSYQVPGGPLAVLKEKLAKTSDFARGSSEDIERSSVGRN